MSETTYQPAAYVPPLLRIAATYPVPQIGEATSPVPGHPDHVDIEINLDLLGGGVSAEFVIDVVASLFRHTPEGGTPTITVEEPDPSAAAGPSVMPFAPRPGGGQTVGAPAGTTLIFNGDPRTAPAPWAATDTDGTEVA